MGKKIANVIAVAFVAALVVGAFIDFAPSTRSEPEKPPFEEARVLSVQTITGGRNTDGQNTDENSEGDSDQSGKGEDPQDDTEPSQQDEPDPGEKEPETQAPPKDAEKEQLDPAEEQTGPEKDQPGDPGDKTPVPSDGGGSSSEDPGSGDDPSGGDSGGEDPHGSGEDGLVTDLTSRTITFSELTDDMLFFYAYYSDPTVNANVRVNYRHQNDSGNGEILQGDSNNYQTKLSLGRNYINISYTDKEGDRQYVRFVITYDADKADENNPEIGANPPNISTNLDGLEGYIENDRFTFQVTATTYKGETIYTNHIRVTLDGEVITNPTGSSTFEYMLYFKQPNVGNVREYRVGVLAWDDEGNSRYKEYVVEYYHKDDGFHNGYVTVVLDGTTVGMGIFETPVTVELLKGENAAQTLLKALEEYGYTPIYAGSVQLGFYLRGIARAGSFPRSVMIPEDLLKAIERDGIDMWLDSHSRDSLSEYDYTRGSGWVYAVNGYYPGKGMSEYFLNPGDTMTIRFTLAYGKDIGAVGASGSYGGRYSSYCGIWIDGGFIPLAHMYEEKEREEATCTKEGRVIYECSRCGEQKEETLEMLAHTPKEISRTEPDCINSGYIEYHCKNCGEIYRETIDALGHDWKETERVEPTCTGEGHVTTECARCHEILQEILNPPGHSWTETGRTEPECTSEGHIDHVCTVCGETWSESIPATGHSYYESIRVEPTKEEDGYIEYTCGTCGDSYRVTLERPTPETP